MRALLLGLWTALTLANFAPAQESTIETTINSQLGAFADRDLDQAFSFASPMIQGMFTTPDNFGMMVEQGYPMVWNNRETEFLETREMGNTIIQRILIRDTDGTAHVLDYAMIETENGWRINGVQLIPAPDVGA